MIVKMKKYLFLIYHEQYAEFLDFLKQAGVVHIAQRDEGVKDNDQLRNKMQISANVKKAIEKAESILGKGEHELMPARNTSIEEGLEVATEFDGKQKAIEALRTKVANLTREMTQMEVWGEFSFERLKQMRDAGLYVNFFSCSASYLFYKLCISRCAKRYVMRKYCCAEKSVETMNGVNTIDNRNGKAGFSGSGLHLLNHSAPIINGIFSGSRSSPAEDRS